MLHYSDVIKLVNGRFFHCDHHFSSFDLYESASGEIQVFGVDDQRNDIFIQLKDGSQRVMRNLPRQVIFELQIPSANIYLWYGLLNGIEIYERPDWFLREVSATDIIRLLTMMRENLEVRSGMYLVLEKKIFLGHPEYDAIYPFEFFDVHPPTG